MTVIKMLELNNNKKLHKVYEYVETEQVAFEQPWDQRRNENSS